MWTAIQKVKPIWFFDATGSIIKTIDKQKRPYLYSIVMHDPETKTVVSLADFITTSHTSINICKFLFMIMHDLKDNMSKAKGIRAIAPFVVTDHSMTLINAVIQTFNGCSILEYLHYTYELIFNGKNKESIEKILPTRLQICAVHFLKIIIKKAKLITKLEKLRHAFVFSFTLLQNATSIQEFKRYLIHIHNLFMQPKFNGACAVSLSIIGNELRNRQLYNNVNLHKESSSDDNSKNNKTVKFVALVENELTNIELNSPFKAYFNKILRMSKSKIVTNKTYNVLGDAINEFYSPELFQVISDRLYHVSMWSGLLIGQSALKNKTGGTTTRLDNNVGEDYFKITKHDPELKNRRVMPSELSSSIYSRTLGKYSEFYEKNALYSQSAAKVSAQTNGTVSQTSNSNLNFQLEKWKDEKQKRKSWQKSVYYKSVENFNNISTDVDGELNGFNNLVELNSVFGPSFDMISIESNVEYWPLDEVS